MLTPPAGALMRAPDPSSTVANCWQVCRPTGLQWSATSAGSLAIALDNGVDAKASEPAIETRDVWPTPFGLPESTVCHD